MKLTLDQQQQPRQEQDLNPFRNQRPYLRNRLQRNRVLSQKGAELLVGLDYKNIDSYSL